MVEANRAEAGSKRQEVVNQVNKRQPRSQEAASNKYNKLVERVRQRQLRRLRVELSRLPKEGREGKS